ncbi:MAG: SGNH/GDSL hydrolase family protein [Chloroflexota bacterium]
MKKFFKFRAIRMDILRLAMAFFRHAKRPFISNRILVLGDSHASVFYRRLFDLRFPRCVFMICSVGGATASGLENPNSKTQAGPKFEQAIRKHPAQVYILLLGEVDTGFVIWYRAQKYQASVDEMLSLAVDRYGNFIRKLRTLGKVIVVSAPLPTIPDENQCGEVANLRKEIRATQRERIQLTLEFNRRVAQACAVEGASFVDLDPFSLDERGLVKRELLNADPCDHHYNPLAYARLLVEKLQPLLATDDL